MYSITLQTNDTVVSSGDILGRLQFAASAEADGGASQLIGAGIYGMGEGSFGSSSNPASLVFITSADDSNAAVPRIKISEDGDIIPIQGSLNIGESGNGFNTVYATGVDTRYVALASNVPSDTTNKLYNDNGTLKFNGSSIGGAGGGGLSDVIEDTSPQLGSNLDINTYSVTGVGNININGNITAENFYGDLDGPIVVECKNETDSTIAAGTPVYVSGYYGANGKASIAPADAGNSSKMPAIGILETAITSDSEGHVHCFGLSTGFDTSSFTVGQTVYVANGGGLTNSRPTGATDLVQNIGRVLRSDASQGRILVLGPGRTNDTPNSLDVTGTITASNLGTGEDNSVVVLDSDGKLRTDEIDSRVWGTSLVDGNGTANYLSKWSDGDTVTNSVVYDNGTNVGIGTALPSYKLDINGDIGLTDSGFYASPTGVMIGTSGWLYNDGQTTLSHGNFSDNGDAQNSSYVLRTSTTNATFTTLQNNGSNVILASNRTMMFTANIVARRTNGQDNAAYKLDGAVVNDGYGASILGTPVKTILYESDSSWDVQAILSGGGAGASDYLLIQGKGASSKNINWVCKLDLVEVGGDISGYTEVNALNIDMELIP
jgi:hypothetical protein